MCALFNTSFFDMPFELMDGFFEECMIHRPSWSMCGRATAAVSRAVVTNWVRLLSIQIRVPKILFSFVLLKQGTLYSEFCEERLSG